MTSGASLDAVGSVSTGPTLRGKVCLGCGQAKEYSAFHRRRHSPDGYRPRCKQCRKASSRAYYEKNVDALKAKSAQFRCEQPKRARACVSAWITRNRSKKRARDREYHREHREEKLAYNKTPERRAAHRANAKYQKARRKAAIAATVQPITAEQWEEIQASYLMLCVYCLERCDDLTMDHVVALNRGGDHTAGNVVPACRKCNREKTDKSVVVFLAERPITAQPIMGRGSGPTLRGSEK